jgi:uncharacterized protein
MFRTLHFRQGTAGIQAFYTVNMTIPSVPPGAVRTILDNLRIVAVVGLSPRTQRDSHRVARYMQDHGYRIVPINPMEAGKLILRERVFATLTEAAAELGKFHHRIQLVNCFRNSEDIPPVVDEAIAVGAQAVWMQQGIQHAGAAQTAAGAGLMVVQDKCLMVEHARAYRVT